MPVRNLSSTVRFKSSDASPEVRKRYGLYDNEDEALAAELNQHHSGDAWKQDQRLKNDITSVLNRLELESVKPGFDVLSQTGFRRGYQVRNRSPGEALHSSTHLLSTDRGRKPSRRHSYIEPRTVHRQLETTEHVAPIHVERTVRFNEPEPPVVHHQEIRERSYSPTWYYTEPSSYSFLQSTAPTRRRTVAQPEGGRALSEYRDTLTAAPTHHHHQQQQKQRWSVYGTTPSVDLGRSRSTPPDVYRISTVTGDRIPIGDKLSRRRNHEYAIGVKLADSQKELDSFNRMLDRRFGDNSVGGGNLWRATSGYSYPSYYPSTYYTSSYPTYYKYSSPVTSTDYSYHTYSPRTRVVSPSGTLVRDNPYSYLDYPSYTTTYSKYVPYSLVNYGRASYSGYEPGYASYSYPRSGYYVGRSRYLL